ncbi:MAG: hypothetical protein RDU14_05445 [Melioribacteraceae bacterium]|nr:hypothetical protein [Melioribacteraceae bacterium]
MSKKKKFNLTAATQINLIESLRNSKRIFARGDWLTKNNIYRTNTTKKINEENDFKTKEKINHITTYIGSSSIIHCFDGWKYLGRAVSSAIDLDLATARHLAYYAELRAAISILSSQGIAVFDKHHVVLGRKEIYIKKGLSTHLMTWKALSHFTNLNRSSESLLKIIKPDHHTLNDWLNTSGVSAIKLLLGKHWLKTWGLDIKRFSKDRESRNYLSYRPSQFNEKYFRDMSSLVLLINNLWESSEYPTFKSIDRQILKASLMKSFYYKTGNDAKTSRDRYNKEVEMIIRNLAPSGYSSDFWFNYLTDMDDESFLIKEASGRVNVLDPRNYVQMICRAFLLLRIASGYIKMNLESADITNEELKFWWLPLIKYLGYTQDDIESFELNDILLTDILSSKKNLVTLITDPSFYTNTYLWRNNYFQDKNLASQFDRVGIIAITT